MTTTTHPLNRHLFIVDNIHLLHRLDNESVDLIVTDPPFGKQKTFTGDRLKPALTSRELEQEMSQMVDWGITEKNAKEKGIIWPDDDIGASYDDIWNWQKVHVEFAEQIKQNHPAVSALIETTRLTHSDWVAAYLAYIAERVIEMRRVLKPTGSIYLHCDYTANAYLRQLFDAIFGRVNFRNEIAWCYRGGGVPKNAFSRKHDSILFYVKDSGNTFNKQYRPYSEDSLALLQSRGGVSIDNLPRDLDRGATMEDYWTDINSLQTWSSERTGYPTQKPVALAERMIQASSNPGDVVLDPFAGCAYVPVAAEGLDRQWIACDISPRAMTVVKRQFNKFCYSVDGGPVLVRHVNMEQAVFLIEADITICGPDGLPERTDTNPEPPPPRLELDEPEYMGQLFKSREVLELLLAESGWMSWCCGYAVRRPDGSIVETADNFQLDHIDPKSAGGRDIIVNRAPLCARCNGIKGRRPITLRQLRDEVIEQGNLLVNRVEDLPDLGKMQDAAARIYAQRLAQKGLLEPIDPGGRAV